MIPHLSLFQESPNRAHRFQADSDPQDHKLNPKTWNVDSSLKQTHFKNLGSECNQSNIVTVNSFHRGLSSSFKACSKCTFIHKVINFYAKLCEYWRAGSAQKPCKSTFQGFWNMTLTQIQFCFWYLRLASILSLYPTTSFHQHFCHA